MFDCTSAALARVGRSVLGIFAIIYVLRRRKIFLDPWSSHSGRLETSSSCFSVSRASNVKVVFTDNLTSAKCQVMSLRTSSRCAVRCCTALSFNLPSLI